MNMEPNLMPATASGRPLHRFGSAPPPKLRRAENSDEGESELFSLEAVPTAPGCWAWASIVGTLGLLLLMWFFTVSTMMNNQHWHSMVSDEFREFQAISEDAWALLQQLSIQRTPDHFASTIRQIFSHRRHRRDYGGGQCQHCSRSVRNCPPGPPGPEGSPGPPGDNGESGQDGRPGAPGIAIAFSDSNSDPGCILCPAGPPGIPGPPGRMGEKGPPGEPGPRGIGGRPGLPGRDGPAGDRGPPGEPGTDGEPGEMGEDGIRAIGRPGPPGQRGRPGPGGETGLTGAPGEPGPRGAEGPPGAAGEPGRDGVDGLPGAPGQSGNSGADALYCECPGRQSSSSSTAEPSNQTPSDEESEAPPPPRSRRPNSAQSRGRPRQRPTSVGTVGYGENLAANSGVQAGRGEAVGTQNGSASPSGRMGTRRRTNYATNAAPALTGDSKASTRNGEESGNGDGTERTDGNSPNEALANGRGRPNARTQNSGRYGNTEAAGGDPNTDESNLPAESNPGNYETNPGAQMGTRKPKTRRPTVPTDGTDESEAAETAEGPNRQSKGYRGKPKAKPKIKNYGEESPDDETEDEDPEFSLTDVDSQSGFLKPSNRKASTNGSRANRPKPKNSNSPDSELPDRPNGYRPDSEIPEGRPSPPKPKNSNPTDAELPDAPRPDSEIPEKPKPRIRTEVVRVPVNSEENEELDPEQNVELGGGFIDETDGNSQKSGNNRKNRPKSPKTGKRPKPTEEEPDEAEGAAQGPPPDDEYSEAHSGPTATNSAANRLPGRLGSRPNPQGSNVGDGTETRGQPRSRGQLGGQRGQLGGQQSRVGGQNGQPNSQNGQFGQTNPQNGQFGGEPGDYTETNGQNVDADGQFGENSGADGQQSNGNSPISTRNGRPLAGNENGRSGGASGGQGVRGNARNGQNSALNGRNGSNLGQNGENFGSNGQNQQNVGANGQNQQNFGSNSQNQQNFGSNGQNQQNFGPNSQNYVQAPNYPTGSQSNQIPTQPQPFYGSSQSNYANSYVGTANQPQPVAIASANYPNSYNRFGSQVAPAGSNAYLRPPMSRADAAPPPNDGFAEPKAATRRYVTKRLDTEGGAEAEARRQRVRQRFYAEVLKAETLRSGLDAAGNGNEST